jgi:hypothetical protein
MRLIRLQKIFRKQLLFVNKKKQKNFFTLDRGVGNTRGPEEQKFFGSFFQKRTAFFPLKTQGT